VRVRDLVWDGCLNVRDLGGLPTEESGETRFGSVIRADSVRQLSEAGWAAAVAYGARTAIDLRSDHERGDDPPHELPIEIAHVPFMKASAREWEQIEVEIEAAAAVPELATATRDVYLIFLEHFRQRVAAAIAAVARAPDGGVVVHCVGGKDRTGLLSAFLLHLAGVAREDIAADYALSEERLRPRHESWFAVAETEAERERIRRIARTPAESMLGVFAELDRRYGSVEGYLRSAGASDDELALARARLRG
jgi:protein-tyrosine phosphatase